MTFGVTPPRLRRGRTDWGCARPARVACRAKRRVGHPCRPFGALLGCSPPAPPLRGLWLKLLFSPSRFSRLASSQWRAGACVCLPFPGTPPGSRAACGGLCYCVVGSALRAWVMAVLIQRDAIWRSSGRSWTPRFLRSASWRGVGEPVRSLGPDEPLPVWRRARWARAVAFAWSMRVTVCPC